MIDLPKFNLEGIDGNTKLALNGILSYLQDSDNKLKQLYANKIDKSSIDTTITLGTSDELVPSQNAVKTYADSLSQNTYSTTETMTNDTWIDDRRIYRKVINFGALPNATQKDVAHGITFGVNTRIIFSNAYGWDGSQFVPIINAFQSGYGGSQNSYLINTTNISLYTNVNMSAITECYFVLEYVY